MTKQKLIEFIDRMREAVLADDSFEGRFAYRTADEPGETDPFEVDIAFRIGNRNGQGGYVLFTEGEWGDTAKES